MLIITAKSDNEMHPRTILFVQKSCIAPASKIIAAVHLIVFKIIMWVLLIFR